MKAPRLYTVAAIALGVLTLLCFRNALWAGFYSDDYTWLARMPATLLRPSFVFSVFYRDFNPLLHASFALDYWLGGGRAVLFHTTSLLLHALNATLLALLLRRLEAGSATALAAAALWALNARLSEPVVWAAARGHSLATLFVLIGLLLLLRPGRSGAWLGAASFLLALLSKEVAFFPMLLVPLLVRRRGRAWRELLPLGGLAAAFLVFNLLAKPRVYAPMSISVMALKAPFILLRPLGLGDLYDFRWASALLVALLFAAAAWLLRRTLAAAGFLWLLACIVPVLPLDKLSSRYLYLPSIGYGLILCGVCRWVAESLRSPMTRRVMAVACAAAVIAVGLTNVLLVQREIEDYRLLSLPYAACLEALRPAAAALSPGETLAVADLSDRQEVLEMTRMIRARGNAMKLIPPRAAAIDGLVELRDAINIERAGKGGHFVMPSGEAAGAKRIFVYDGRSLIPVAQLPSVEPSHIFVVHIGSIDSYVAYERMR